MRARHAGELPEDDRTVPTSRCCLHHCGVSARACIWTRPRGNSDTSRFLGRVGVVFAGAEVLAACARRSGAAAARWRNRAQRNQPVAGITAMISILFIVMILSGLASRWSRLSIRRGGPRFFMIPCPRRRCVSASIQSA
jgi:hypothetical protein